MRKIKVLFHGSPNKLKGNTLNPSKGNDSEERPENNQFGVYASDRRDLAIVMGIFGCKDVIGGSIDEYKDDKLNAKLYESFQNKNIFIFIIYLLKHSNKLKLTLINLYL